MNTPSNLDFVLNELHAKAKGVVISEAHDFTITCRSLVPENLGEYLEAVELLKKGKVIESYKISSQGEEDIETEYGEYDTERVTLCFLKLNCRLKPKTLISFMVETSRLPKYTLSLDKQRRLVLNNTHLITTPHVNSQNFYFIDYALKHPGKTITRGGINKSANVIKNKFHKITNQILKNPNLIRVFFLDTKKTSTIFRNEVTLHDMAGQNINENEIIAFLETCRKINL